MATLPRKSQLDVLEEILEATAGGGDSPAAAGLTNDELRATPIPVTVGEGSSINVTIGSGFTPPSNYSDLGLMRLGRIDMPAAWDAAKLSFSVSSNGENYRPLFDKDGNEYTVTVAAGRSTLIPLADMLSVRYISVRSGTTAATVAQSANRTLTLVLVP